MFICRAAGTGPHTFLLMLSVIRHAMVSLAGTNQEEGHTQVMHKQGSQRKTSGRTELAPLAS